MKHKLNQTLSASYLKLRIESKKSKVTIMISYLQFLYRRHPALELEIITMMFLNKERSYQQFISGQLSYDLAIPLCQKLTVFLENRGYPISFIEHKTVNDSLKIV